jgi:hypothetical protein
MTNVNNELQNEFDELKKDYEEAISEANAEIEASQSMVSATEMHLFNIAFAAVMIIIGAILVYQTRGVQLKNGKKIAGWILLILGIITVIAHVLQLIF